MASLKQFITDLAKKAGYDTTTQAAFFDALPDVEVPGEVQTGLDNQLISITQAKNNHPELSALYRKQALDGVDSTILALFDEYEIPEETRREILGERSSYKRIPALTAKIADLNKAKAGAGSVDKAAIQKEIDALQASLRTEKADRVKDKAEYDKQLNGFKVNSKLETLLAGHKTTVDDLDPDTRNVILLQTLTKALQDNQAQFAYDDNGSFVVKKLDGTNLFGENHQQITPAQLIEQTLAKTKLLKVSNGQPANPSPTNGSYTPPANGNGKDEKNPNAAAINYNKQAIIDMENSMKSNPMPMGM